MGSLLTSLNRERRLAAEIRQLLLDLDAALTRGEGDAADASRLRQAAIDLEDLFLVVVVGEWNAGKSALINVLIGRQLLEEGVTPTTTSIQVLTFAGEEAKTGEHKNVDGGALRTTEGVVTRVLAVPELKDIKIVDTPGTNAIVREHEVITRDFMPRADLVLFVTSADRPFTETERAFLEAIAAWGKKVVFVVNKADLLTEPEEREVKNFVSQAIAESLGFGVPVFAVSARLAAQRVKEGATDLTLIGPSGPLASRAANQPTPAGDGAERVLAGWRDLVAWLRSVLDSPDRLRLKLSNPLGLALRVLGQAKAQLDARRRFLAADERALDGANGALARFETETRTQFGFRLEAIENHLLRLSKRAEAFLDTYYRLGRLRALLDGDGLRQAFESEVIGTTPQAIAAEVDAMVDWLVDREHAQRLEVKRSLVELEATGAQPHLETGPGEGFAKRRQDLLASVGRRAEEITAAFNPSTESARLVAGIHDTLAHAGLAEAGALGLGLLLKAIIAPAILEATGVVAAGLLVALGLSFIPRRRAQAAKALHERVATLSDDLRVQLTASLDQELDENRRRWQEALAPYADFLQREQTDLAQLETALTALDRQREGLSRSLTD